MMGQRVRRYLSTNLFSEEAVPFCISSNMRNPIFPYPLLLLYCQSFQCQAFQRMYSETSLNCFVVVFLITNNVEHLFMTLCMFCSGNISNILPISVIGLFVLSLVNSKSSLYISMSYIRQEFCNIFSQIVACLIIFFIVACKKHKI